MADLLLVLLTLGLLVFAHLMRTLLAVRIPAALAYKPTKLKQAPDIMAGLFSQADQELTNLGFAHSHWATVQTTPPLPGFTAPLIRLYHHKTQPIIARVSPPYTIDATDQCRVVFLSISKGKTFLATANRVPELFPRPSETLSIMVNTKVDTLAEQFRAHTKEMAQRNLQWLNRSDEMGEAAWSFRVANRYEKKSIKWMCEQGYVKALPDGSAVPSLVVVLRFLARFVIGREHNPPPEKSTIPAARAAYLFQNWRQTFQMPPPLTTQLGLFLVSALAFALLAGLFWGWTFGLLLLGVITFHEAGHWLAMRLLGYRNLQILMLPLVGGVTLGQETTSNATHRILVSLMGPLPGIVLGMLVLWLAGTTEGWLFDLGLLLLAVNYLNLLPIVPLDGGQLLKAVIPNRSFNLLIGLEWLGAAALLLLAWLTDSLFLAALALLPIFGGLALLKRKRVLGTLQAQETRQAPLNDQITAVIEAIDQNDKHYRPLVKKAMEIDEILATQRLRPAAPAVAGAFLGIYIASFLLPPIVAYSASPTIRQLSSVMFADPVAAGRDAYDQAMALPMPQLVTELAAKTRFLARQYHPQTDTGNLSQPATREAMAQAEQRLGIRLDGEYRQFLETSDGFINTLAGVEQTGYLLLPLEQVDRFKNKLPELLSSLQTDPAGQDEPIAVYQYSEYSDEESVESVLYRAQLGEMLVIGSRYGREYLLLEPSSRTDVSPPVYLVNATPDGVSGRRFSSLRDYLANNLSLLYMIDMGQSAE